MAAHVSVEKKWCAHPPFHHCRKIFLQGWWQVYHTFQVGKNSIELFSVVLIWSPHLGGEKIKWCVYVWPFLLGREHQFSDTVMEFHGLLIFKFWKLFAHFKEVIYQRTGRGSLYYLWVFPAPRWDNLPSGHQRYPLKGLNLGYMYWGQKHSSE